MFESLYGDGGDQPKDAFEEVLRETTPRAFVTPTLLGLNVLYFGAMALVGVSVLAPTGEQLIDAGANFGALTLNGQWLRLLLSMFIHIGWIHLAFNMWCLWVLGRVAERAYGNWMFFAIYMTSGLSGSIASVLWNPANVSAGASGAVFGVAGALVAFYALEGRGVPDEFLSESRNSLLAFVGYNLFYGFTSAGIDNAAHLGGLLMGLALGASLYRPLEASRPRPSARHATALALAAVMLVVGGWAARQSAEDMPLVIAVGGDIHFEASEWDDALEHYQRVIELDSRFTYVHQNIGIIYTQKGMPDEAREAFAEGLKLDPHNVMLLNLHADACIIAGDLATAIEELERAAELQPELPLTYQTLGRARDESSDEAGAAEAYERRRELTPLDPDAINAIAWLYATADDPEVRNPEMALLLAKRAVELSKGELAYIRDTLAEAHYVNDEYDEAIEIETALVAADPDNEFYKEQLAKYEKARRR